MLVSGGDDDPDLFFESSEGPKASHYEPVNIPEATKAADEEANRVNWIEVREDLGKVGHVSCLS